MQNLSFSEWTFALKECCIICLLSTCLITCGRRPTGHKVIPVVVVVVVVGVGAETTFKPMYDVWVSSKKPFFYKAHVWFWCPCMILVPKYDFGAHVCSLWWRGSLGPSSKWNRSTKKVKEQKVFFHTMISDWRGTPFFFYDDKGSHPKMKLECETQTAWTSDLISLLWFPNGVWPPPFITRGSHHFLFLLRISAAGHWTR